MDVPIWQQRWAPWWTSPLVYEWHRNLYGLMPLLGNCSKRCWLSDATSTEWKNYSLPRYNYVAWQFGNMPFSVFRSRMLGTRSLYASGREQSEMSIRVRKSALRLRISKSLTCDVVNARLSETFTCATRPSRTFVFVTVAPRIYGKTSLQLSVSASSSPLWSAEKSPDPVADMKAWRKKMLHGLRQELPEPDGDEGEVALWNLPPNLQERLRF